MESVVTFLDEAVTFLGESVTFGGAAIDTGSFSQLTFTVSPYDAGFEVVRESETSFEIG